jgi:hypothetical protein
MTLNNQLKKLIALNIILLVAIVAVAMLNSQPKNSTIENTSNFMLEDSAQVTKIVFGKTVLVKEALGNWVANDSIQVDDLMIEQLLGLLQKLTVKRSLAPKSQDEVLPLLAQQGQKVEFYAGNQLQKSFTYIVHNKETIAQLPNDTPVVLKITNYNKNAGDIFSLSPKEWKNKTLISTGWQSLKLLVIDYPKNPENSFSLTFDTLAYQQQQTFFFQFKEAKNLDSVMVFNYVQALNSVRVQRYIDDKALQDSITKQPVFCQIMIEDLNSRRNRKIKVFARNNQLFTFNETTQQFALVDTKYFAGILLRRKDFEK